MISARKLESINRLESWIKTKVLHECLIIVILLGTIVLDVYMQVLYTYVNAYVPQCLNYDIVRLGDLRWIYTCVLSYFVLIDIVILN